jgi:pantoate--beta-alanine ligase
MGALHDGHLSLVQGALRECDRVVASLFVNPTQFGPNEDIGRYPRDEAGDGAKLAGAGAHLLYAPDAGEMYAADRATTVTVARLTDHLCGPFRPGHFAGVATVVTKLLNQAMPDRAYFGEKDFQQLQVIRRLARDLDIPVEIVGMPTLREADGLAMSSRNRYLGDRERRVAGELPRVMAAVVARLGARPLDVAEALRWGLDEFARAGIAKVDYLTLADPLTLQPLGRADRPARLFVAAWVGATRLIDNMALSGTTAAGQSAE